MSKRSEEAALKAYPNDCFVGVEYADMCRSFYQDGYKQAEKDIIKRACNWWKEHLHDFLGDGLAEGVVDEFCKAMKEK